MARRATVERKPGRPPTPKVGRPSAAKAGKPSAAKAEPGQVQSLNRALAILKTLAESAEGMTLSDLSQVLGLAPSTAHRLLTTLEGQRFVRLDHESMAWQVGVGAFTVGTAFARSRDIVPLARPHLRRLMEASGETANLYVEIGGEAVCMSQIECRQTMRAISRPGGRAKMHGSGSGKAILAYLDADEVTHVLRTHGLPRLTERTLDTPKRLREDLARVRERGFAFDDEEVALGLRCVAAAVLDEDGRPQGAISISGPLVRMTDAALPRLGGLVVEAAGAVMQDLGVG